MTLQREPIGDYARSPEPHPRGGRGAFLLLVFAYVVFTLLAIPALRVPGVGVAGQELSVRRSVFAAVNATTLTGFQQDVGSVRPGAEVLRLVLTLGGTLFALTAGGMAVVRIARMNYSDGQIAWAAFVVTAATTIGGAAFLLDSERGLTAALLQSASAFGNSGLYAGELPGVMDWRTHAVLMPLAFAGGLGLPVLMEIFDRITGAKRFSRHTQIVLVLAAGAYLAGLVAIVLFDGHSSSRHGGAAPADWRYTAAVASTLSIDARTAGMPFEFAAALSRPAQWVLIALMIIGGSPGGTAGGLKTTTIWRLGAGLRENLRGRHLSRSFGIAACWATVYFAGTLIGFLLLLRSEPDTPADRLLFLSFSAFSNAGLSHDPVSITGDGLFTLSAMMFAGRLAPLFVLWWMASTVDDDTVAIG